MNLRAKRAALYQVNLARAKMPRTIELLGQYAEGPERERAFALVAAACEELAAHLEDEHRDRNRRIASLLERLPLDRATPGVKKAR